MIYRFPTTDYGTDIELNDNDEISFFINTNTPRKRYSGRVYADENMGFMVRTKDNEEFELRKLIDITKETQFALIIDGGSVYVGQYSDCYSKIAEIQKENPEATEWDIQVI